MTRPEKAEAIGVSDAQCPRCGGFGARYRDFRRDPLTGKELAGNERYNTDRRLALLLFFVLTALFAAVLNAIFPASSMWWALVLGAVVTLGVLAVRGFSWAREDMRAQRFRSYECLRCLHRWDWRVGSPPARYNEVGEIWEDFRNSTGDLPEQDGRAVSMEDRL